MERCSVCGRNPRYHKMACWKLVKDGKQVEKPMGLPWEAHGMSRCRIVQIWQSAFLAGMGELKPIRNCKVCNPPQLDPPRLCGAYGAHDDCVLTERSR